MIYAGIDAGSRTVKAVLLEAPSLRVLAGDCVDQGVGQGDLADRLLEGLLAQAGLTRADLAGTIATGYARSQVRCDTTITEISCHAAGVHHLLSETRTVIDIGGQDSKVIRLDAGGRVRDFAMNDRCAAGTGRFLELVAQRVEAELAELGQLAARSHKPSAISSMCAVFAETEIIGLLAGGASRQDIVSGVQSAIAARISALAGEVDSPVVFTGGVARIAGMASALERALHKPVTVAPDPLMTGALGAAILASRRRA